MLITTHVAKVSRGIFHCAKCHKVITAELFYITDQNAPCCSENCLATLDSRIAPFDARLRAFTRQCEISKLETPYEPEYTKNVISKSFGSVLSKCFVNPLLFDLMQFFAFSTRDGKHVSRAIHAIGTYKAILTARA